MTLPNESTGRQGVLADVLHQHLNGNPMKDLTVLAPQRDPFRMDMPRRHVEGKWFAEQVERIGKDQIHVRGIHYATLGQPKPDGKPYTNTPEDWEWLSDDAVKSARWLDYVPFDKIIDQRNAPPVIRQFERPEPITEIGISDFEIKLPEIIEPRPWLLDYRGIQPYRLAMFGEKVSLEPVLAPIAEQRMADLYLPTGESSDTMVYLMAKAAAEDGRPLVVFYFADCDPPGYEMAANVGRKLQAFSTLQFPDLRFEMRPVALKPDQVREYGLPSTPIKETEKRAARWIENTGVEQTEIDAIATLQPDLLDKLARKAIKPFWDSKLDERVREAKEAWYEGAEQALTDQVGEDELAQIEEQAEGQLAEIQQQIENLKTTVEIEGVELPDPPEVIHGEARGNGNPLISSEWDWTGQTRALIAHKSYQPPGGQQ